MIKQYKVNSQIIVPQVRVVADDGKQIGVLSRDEALEYATASGADLVLIGEQAKPPVAKVIDFKKFLYQESKKEGEAKRGQRGTGTKEIRVGSALAATADVQARINQTAKLLADGFNVKVVIKFKGRQMAHPEFAHKIITNFSETLSGKGRLSRPARIEGKTLVGFFEPDHNAKTENK
ncbi:translation initiation factor IF-3 [Candidatus Microgenomates bacterium]|nr:translation initiation factor IF-3 [Candidatus Microgenomates bacterium]